MRGHKKQPPCSARLTELDVTLQRFASLDAVYRSDIARLEALEEGGFILSAMGGQDCAVCGAPPSAQRHNHAADEIERSHAAAAAEARKIEREQRDLARTVASLTAKSNELRSAMGELDRSLVAIEQKIADARPKEAAVRNDYEVFFSRKSDLEMITSLLARRDALIVKKSQVEEKPPTPKPEDKMPVGIYGPTAYAFGKTVREILEDLAVSSRGGGAVRSRNQRRHHRRQGARRQRQGREGHLACGGQRGAVHLLPRAEICPRPDSSCSTRPCSPIANRCGAGTENCPPTKSSSKRTSLATHFYNLPREPGRRLGQFVVIENADRRPTSPRRCRSRRSRQIRIPVATDCFP